MFRRASALVLRPPILVNLFLVSVIGIFCITSLKFSDISSVIIGFSPANYTYLKLQPHLFDGGFPNNIQIYDASAPMRSYLYLKQFFQIEPENTAIAFILIQSAIVTIGIYHLSRTLGSDYITAVVIVSVLAVSNLPGVNLARFGDGLQNQVQPLYYGFGQGFRLFAISYFLRQKHSLGFIFLGLTMVSHLTMGIAAIVFVASYYLFHIREALTKDFLKPAIVVSAFCILFFFFTLADMSIGAGGISNEDFIRATRSYSFHWHPITLGLFGNLAPNVVWPLVFSSFLFLIGLSQIPIENKMSQKLIFGAFAMIALSAVGIFLSDVKPVVFFVKLSIQRSSEIISLLGVILGITASIRLLKDGNWLEIIFSAIALASILSPSKLDIAFLAWSLVMFCFLTRGWFGPLKILPTHFSVPRWSIILALMTMPFILLYFFNHDLFDDLNRLPKTFGMNLTAILTVVLLKRAATFFDIGANSLKASIVVVCFFCLVFILENRNDRLARYSDRYKSVAEDMLAAQIWANVNTPPGALFLTDPSWKPGWRDYSKRPIFGHYRDWALFGFAYNSSEYWYREGLRRLKLFGVDPVNLANELESRGKSIWETNQMTREIIRNSFNSRPMDSLVQLSRREGISYIVVKNDRYSGLRTGHTAVFSTTYFDIYSVEDAR